MQKQLNRLRTIATILDDAVRIPGTRIRFGLDPLLGLLPGGGDAVTGAVATYAIVLAARLGAPPAVIARMAVNVLVDVATGTIPLLGDLFDVGWKSNRKNVQLLERYQAEPQKVKASSWVLVGVVLLLILAAIVGVFVLTAWLLRAIF
ncbi:MAG TPA: DUF4112 domain-containing protein [Longimicrobiales bacterium]|nr:DUF4112 domain-containing protein [Longimicrobiales bacterium]